MKVYLSGPMSGIPEYNFPAFREAACDLRSRGYEVVSPHELDEAEGFDPVTDGVQPHDERYAQFLARDIQVMAAERVEAVVVLPGWESSGGAQTEVAFGRALGLPILRYPDLADVDRPADYPTVIGLTGQARVGKDTVAGFIADVLSGLRVRREGFADALKVSAARALGIGGSREECIAHCDRLKTDGEITVRDPQTGERVIPGRRFLQWYGTEAHRDLFGADFWLDFVLPPHRRDCDVLVIPDVRYDNEAQRIRDRGGVVWRVERPGAGMGDRHRSEAGVSDELVDRVICNDGTLDDLYAAVHEALVDGAHL